MCPQALPAMVSCIGAVFMSLDCVIHVQRYWVMPVKMIQNDPPRPGTLVVDFKVEILRPVLFRLSSGIDICTLALCGR